MGGVYGTGLQYLNAHWKRGETVQCVYNAAFEDRVERGESPADGRILFCSSLLLKIPSHQGHVPPTPSEVGSENLTTPIPASVHTVGGWGVGGTVLTEQHQN